MQEAQKRSLWLAGSHRIYFILGSENRCFWEAPVLSVSLLELKEISVLKQVFQIVFFAMCLTYQKCVFHSSFIESLNIRVFKISVFMQILQIAI